VTPRLAALAAFALVGGCATVLPPAGPGDWPDRRAELQALDAWTLEGRVAVAAGDDGFSGGFDWSQAGETAEVELSGPMGGSLRIRIEGDHGFTTIGGADSNVDDARKQLARYFGPDRQLPASEMRYWLVGAPAPGSPHEETLGEDQRLASLEQSGWRVRYDRYEAIGALALPSRMEMTTEGLRLRVVVSDWRFPP
jgi:outer membrane lipoprotein LolB